MATRYTELALDGANLYIVNRIREGLKSLNKTEEEATKELFLTAFKDYSSLEDSLDEINKKLTSNNGISMLGIMKKSFNIDFISALNKTLDKLGSDIFDERLEKIIKELSLDFKIHNDFYVSALKPYRQFDCNFATLKCFDDGNIFEMEIFTIKDTLKPIDEYIEEIRDNERYRNYITENPLDRFVENYEKSLEKDTSKSESQNVDSNKLSKFKKNR